MNTPAHLLLGAAIFGKAERRRTTLAAFLGAFAPDLSLYLMVSVSIWVLGIPAQTVFRDLYYSDAWQAVFAVDNSFILWGVLLALAIWRKLPILFAFSGSGLMHLALDFPLHTHDARMHFWPLSNWVFESTVSYWDSRAHANIVGPIEVLLSLGAAIYIWRKHAAKWVLALTGVLLAMEIFSSGVWQFVF